MAPPMLQNRRPSRSQLCFFSPFKQKEGQSNALVRIALSWCKSNFLALWRNAVMTKWGRVLNLRVWPLVWNCQWPTITQCEEGSDTQFFSLLTCTELKKSSELIFHMLSATFTQPHARVKNLSPSACRPKFSSRETAFNCWYSTCLLMGLHFPSVSAANRGVGVTPKLSSKCNRKADLTGSKRKTYQLSHQPKKKKN